MYPDFLVTYVPDCSFKLSCLNSHWAGKFTGTAILDNESGDSILADFTIRHLISNVGIKLCDTIWPVIDPGGKNILRTGGMTYLATGVTRRESFNRLCGFKIPLNEDRAKSNTGPPFRIQQEVASANNAQPGENCSIF